MDSAAGYAGLSLMAPGSSVLSVEFKVNLLAPAVGDRIVARGRVVIEMDAEQAPQTTWTVAGFARDGLYDGVPFHRVVPNFVIQGGDFERGDGWGGPGFEIRTEPTRIAYERGTAGMASAGRDTEGSQWFVTHSIQPHLNGRYTAFGRVVEGLDVVDRVLQGDRVTSARVIGAGPTP